MNILIVGLLIIAGIFSLLNTRGSGTPSKRRSKSEIAIAAVYVLSLLMFACWLSGHSSPYYKAIDPFFDDCYSPFGEKHLPTLLVFFVLHLITQLSLWRRGLALPPLTFVLAGTLLLIGMAIDIAIILQVSLHDTSTLHFSENNPDWLPIFVPLISVIISVTLITQLVAQKLDDLRLVTYQHKFLQGLNSFLAKRASLPFWIVILTIPVFFIITLVLTLFGQEMDAMVKVFTDTTTWRFSQQMHPPVLDHQGHYLCTVAAKGNPAIVKPLFVGKRGNRPIIVNRQLQIANAFEAMLEHSHPKIHRVIRKLYDRYGLNVSLAINNVARSNITYLLMKPLEWVFLIYLYLFCEKPEGLIARQYR